MQVHWSTRRSTRYQKRDNVTEINAVNLFSQTTHRLLLLLQILQILPFLCQSYTRSICTPILKQIFHFFSGKTFHKGIFLVNGLFLFVACVNKKDNRCPPKTWKTLYCIVRTLRCYWDLVTRGLCLNFPIILGNLNLTTIPVTSWYYKRSGKVLNTHLNTYLTAMNETNTGALAFLILILRDIAVYVTAIFVPTSRTEN